MDAPFPSTPFDLEMHAPTAPALSSRPPPVLVTPSAAWRPHESQRARARRGLPRPALPPGLAHRRGPIHSTRGTPKREERWHQLQPPPPALCQARPLQGHCPGPRIAVRAAPPPARPARAPVVGAVVVASVVFFAYFRVRVGRGDAAGVARAARARAQGRAGRAGAPPCRRRAGAGGKRARAAQRRRGRGGSAGIA